MVSFVDEVAALPGGEQIRSCIQCGICTGSCPMASRMEFPTRKMIGMIRADMRDEVLSSNSPWNCLSCYMCTVRCPRGVRPTELAHALESLASRHGYRPSGTRTPAMYDSFVRSVKGNGRVYELGMMVRFYMRTNPLAAVKLLPVALKLLARRRLPLAPPRARGKAALARLLKTFREEGEPA